MQDKYQQAIDFILSSEHVKKENAKINTLSYRFINSSKNILRKIGLFSTVKRLAYKTQWWKQNKEILTTKWGTDVSGGVYFYQSFPMLGLKGLRPTDLRIQTYGLYDILDSSMNVLDIGCNAGFFDMTIADKVNTITGVEYDKDFADVAAGTAKILELDNVTFINADANEWLKTNMANRYNLILSFAVHGWMKISSEDYSRIISELLLPGGYLVFESHGLKDGEEFIDAFMSRSMEKLSGGVAENIDASSGYHRVWAVLRMPDA